MFSPGRSRGHWFKGKLFRRFRGEALKRRAAGKVQADQRLDDLVFQFAPPGLQPFAEFASFSHIGSFSKQKNKLITFMAFSEGGLGETALRLPLAGEGGAKRRMRLFKERFPPEKAVS